MIDRRDMLSAGAVLGISAAAIAAAGPAHAQYLLALRGLERRIRRAQHERAGHANVLERLTDDRRFQEIEVNREVGKLGHAAPIIARRSRGRQVTA